MACLPDIIADLSKPYESSEEQVQPDRVPLGSQRSPLQLFQTVSIEENQV